MSDRETVLLLGGPRHGTTVDVEPDRSTISFPTFDPPGARWATGYPAEPEDVTVTQHDYDRTKLVDLDGAVILLYVCRDDPRTLRSLFPGSPLTVVDHRDRHPSFRDWRRETPRTDPAHHCDICSGTGRDYLGRPCRRHGDPR